MSHSADIAETIVLCITNSEIQLIWLVFGKVISITCGINIIGRDGIVANETVNRRTRSFSVWKYVLETTQALKTARGQPSRHGQSKHTRQDFVTKVAMYKAYYYWVWAAFCVSVSTDMYVKN